jgi:trk system potassium uptake protein
MGAARRVSRGCSSCAPTSALGTVGFSMGATPMLDDGSRWLVALCMYMGRVGPLTLALAVGERVKQQGFQYPEGRLAVG